MPAAAPGRLIPAAGTDAGGTPEQERFAHLVQRIQAARERLQRFDTEEPRFAHDHARLLRPLLQQWVRARRDWVEALDVLVDDRGWTRAERAAIQRDICHGVRELLQAGDDASLRALHDRHAEVPLPPPHGAAPTPEDDAEGPAARRAERKARRKAAAGAGDDGSPGGDARSSPSATAPTPVDTARSLREVYRKLASALHPDRESDPARRLDKTALMQRANRAHDSGDLLTLLEMQHRMAAEAPGAPLATPADSQRLRAVNQALADQLAGLDRDTAQRAAELSARYGLPDRMRPDPAQWQRWLAEQVQALESELADQRRQMMLLGNRQAMKRWLRGRF